MMSKLSGFTFAVCAALLGFLVSACVQKKDNQSSFPRISTNFNLHWADSSFWDDGKAEVAHYQGVRKIYGKNRNYELTLITVSEDFNEEFRVKTDDYKRSDLYKVIKVNSFANIPTDNYPYHFLSSFFFMRADPLELHKVTLSSQEWCGNTFKEFMKNEDEYLLNYSSYWDTEGTGKRSLALGKETLFEDQLIYSLRALNFDKHPQFEIRVLASQVGNKVGRQDIYDAKVKVDEADSAFRVEVALDDTKVNVYEFDKKYPNSLISLTTWDGQSLKRSRISRYAYWQN